MTNHTLLLHEVEEESADQPSFERPIGEVGEGGCDIGTLVDETLGVSAAGGGGEALRGGGGSNGGTIGGVDVLGEKKVPFGVAENARIQEASEDEETNASTKESNEDDNEVDVDDDNVVETMALALRVLSHDLHWMFEKQHPFLTQQVMLGKLPAQMQVPKLSCLPSP
ncbi:hypothetical protein L6164_012688 [Bauhinia variegata]|uniref:Uncharacterized protein n=1 Tax=Bauhinia variegata TaxID=167791 RepID=A0ACB9PA10_BAUVA|nr:hypothetical protein L6164_012688 [Bauhinia variegata]